MSAAAAFSQRVGPWLSTRVVSRLSARDANALTLAVLRASALEELPPRWQAVLRAAGEEFEGAPIAKYDPDQPRDEAGRWTDGGGSAGELGDLGAPPLELGDLAPPPLEEELGELGPPPPLELGDLGPPPSPSAARPPGRGEAVEIGPDTRFDADLRLDGVVRPSARTDLSSDEVAAATNYQRAGYRAMNGLLRGRAPTGSELPEGAERELVLARIGHLDRALEKSALLHDTTLYRGAKIRSIGGEELFTPGHEFTDAGYSSFTYERSVAAESFAEQGDAPTALLVIRQPAGSRALYMDDDDEGEVLLPRSTRYRVSRVERAVRFGRETVRDVVHLEVIPGEAPPAPGTVTARRSGGRRRAA